MVWYDLVWQHTWNICTRYYDGTPSLPLTLSKKGHRCSQNWSLLHSCFWFCCQIGNFPIQLFRIRNWQIGEEAHAKEWKQICSHLQRRLERICKREEIKVGWKSSDRFCAGIFCLARGVSCLRLLAAGPVGNCGREEGEAIEAREAKEAIEAGTTTNTQKIQEE